ncbi:MAG: universal stress protein [Qingshengfaniella sp.]
MIRKIVVPVRGDGKGVNVLAHAVALARRHKSHILVAHCRPRPEDMLPFGVPMPQFARDQLMKQSIALANAEEETLRERLRARAEKLGLNNTDTPVAGTASIQFIEEAGKMADLIRHHGRLADLIAVAQPDKAMNLGANTLKSALFHTGSPVLMCPPTETVPDDLGNHVAIAWNGSLEASRAVTMTMPIIEAASRVTILHGSTGAPHGATTEDLLAYLSMRGVTAQRVKFDAKRGVAKGLLAATRDQGADMLIMGAYGDSHEREILFGGNTQTIVEKADSPILMVH